jgi:uncharacterized protein YjiS (DUF1127 family)
MPQIKTFTAAQPTSHVSFFGQLRNTVSAALTRRRERAMLAHLDPHLLRDIGLPPETAKEEAEKPFWRP